MSKNNSKNGNKNSVQKLGLANMGQIFSEFKFPENHPEEAPHAANIYNANTSFINPYTFFPIDKTEPERTIENHGTLTGKIECQLEVQTPVFIPNTSGNFEYLGKGTKHFFTDFFSYTDLSNLNNTQIPNDSPHYPRIPGSEIRGMVRNVYEQLTNSCLSVIDDQNLPYKRTNKPKKAAIWDRKTDELYAVEKLMLNTTGDALSGVYVSPTSYSTGAKVYVELSAKTYGDVHNKKWITLKYVQSIDKEEKLPLCTREGYVLIGENFNNKHHNAVFLFNSPSPGNPFRKLTPSDKNRFQAVLDRYEKYASYKTIYKDPKNNRYLPVYYGEVGTDNIYLSPACMTKEVFSNTISYILNQHQNKHDTCDGKDGLWCPACRLFGMVGKNGKDSKAIASRIRFLDSQPIENAEFDVPRVLPILATPHYSSTEFYLAMPAVMQDAQGRYKEPKGVWNYDYYETYELDHGDTYRLQTQAMYKAKLRGRKVYWRGAVIVGPTARTVANDYHNNANKADYIKKNQLQMRTAIRPLLSGKCTFFVYFEDATKEELSSLLHCLDLNGKAHRIGRGKPYGLGTVSVNILSVHLRTYKMSQEKIEVSLDSVNRDDYSLDDKYDRAKNNIAMYSSELTEDEKNLVDYPKPQGGTQIFRWFGNNRGSVTTPRIEQVLPHIRAKNKTLEK